jgi:hypothetical protein
MMKLLPGFLLAISVVCLPLQARQIAGIEMPDAMDMAGAPLILNGAGVRTKMFMDIYAGGLYLVAKNSAADKIIQADEPMAIRLHMVSGLVTSEAMEEATRDGFDNATGGDTSAIASDIEAFIQVFREPISEGDIFEIAYQPGKGMQVYKNGEFKSTVDGGLPFKQATFAIWLGDKPAHSGLKKGMLGK